MRHQKAQRKLGRNSSHRQAMFRNMVTSLMLHGRIKTTEAKAKEVRRIAEKVLTLGIRVPPSSLEGLTGAELADAKAARVHAIRLARRQVTDRAALDRIFNEYSERYKTRPGGYTRIYKLGRRAGDNAPMNLIELVTEDYTPRSEAAPVEEAPAEPEPEPEPEAEEPVEEEDSEDTSSEDSSSEDTSSEDTSDEDSGDDSTS